MTPFDWYVQMDRPLVNSIELFQVRDTTPYRVTDQFLLGSGTAPGVSYENGVALWRSTNNGLARALECLTVKPYTVGVPHGGRIPGKINLNAIQDQRVLSGLFDAKGGTGNVFDDAHFVNTTVWSGWMGSRTPAGTTTLANGTTTLPNGTPVETPVHVLSAPGESVFDANATGASYNQPFLSFGAPAAAANGTFAYGVGGSEELTILRAGGNSLPYLYATPSSKATPPTYPTSQPNGPTYMQAEPLRKILNNTTTVSHTYLVYLTIGYFNATTPPTPAGWPSNVPVPPQLGAEAFISVPGDMRQKVVAVVDMSNMALDPVNNTAATVQPFFTSLEATATTANPKLTISYSSYDNTTNPVNPTIYVTSDGVNVPITAGSNLIIGYGTEQQLVNVSKVVGAGQIQVTGMSRTAYAGTCVSNVRPGYPGPQSSFSYTSPTYTPVLPYFNRIQ